MVKPIFDLGDLMEYLHRHNFKDYQRNNLTSKLKQLTWRAILF